MKMTKSLFLAFAGLGLFACSNEEVTTENGNGETASVVIKLNGINSPSRGIGDGTEGADQSTEEMGITNATVVFSDGNKIVSTAELDITEAKAGGEVFHNLPSTITQVLVVGNAKDKSYPLTNDTPISTLKSSLIATTEQSKINVTLFGEDTSLDLVTPNTDSEHPNGNLLKAEMDVKPLIARIEVGDIQCEDLGSLYSKLELKVVGLLNYYNQTDLAGNGNTPMVMDEQILEPGSTSTEEGQYVWGETAAGYDWAWDKLSNASLTDNTPYNPGTSGDQKFVYQVSPKAVDSNPIYAGLYVSATPAAGQGSGMALNTTLKGKLGTLSAGSIYRVTYKFKESDIHPWNPNETNCIQVDVTVKPWTIVDLTPTFE